VDRPTRFPPLLDVSQGAALAGSCGLTPRELEVLTALTCGLSDAGVAVDLRVSVETARKHRQAVLRKCGCTSRLQIVLWLVHDYLLANGSGNKKPTGGSTP
jgi:DNA-binding NarL/FixJ family response regulator